jgi:probable HAF family extracellular repeat protein
MTDLGTLGGNHSHTVAINEAGQVIGLSTLADDVSQHAFVWDDGVMTDLGTLGGSYTQPTAINEAGQVLGLSYLAGDASRHAFVWEDGVMTDLSTLGGSYSYPVAINEAGQVIGLSTLADDVSQHAFVTTPSNQPPTASAGGPYFVNEGGSVQVTATGSDPENGSLTYTWDLDNNGSFETPGQTVTFSAVGLEAPDNKIVRVEVTDEGGLAATDQTDVTIIHNFSDFLPPTDPLPTFNAVKAGVSVPVRFSLSGDQGLNIFAEGYPKSEAIQCDSNAQLDGIEEAASAGNSNLSYDPTTDIYTYVWKTDKVWANTCRQLVLKFDDGTFHRANFEFK